MLHAWFSHPDFHTLVEEAWSANNSVPDIMRTFRRSVSTWNHFKFGNIFERKRRSLAHLGGIQRAHAVRDSAYLRSLEQTVSKVLDTELAEEESLWQQKSRI